MRKEDIVGSVCKKCNSGNIIIVQTSNNGWIGICDNRSCMKVYHERCIITV